MTTYKELADRLQKPGPGTAEFYEACDEAAAILRSLDAQRPVATVTWYWHSDRHGSFSTDLMVPPLAGIKSGKEVTVYAAPVAAQPTSATLLVRDLAASLCVQPLAVCEALKEFGFGNFSVNMAVPADAVKVIESKFAQPQQAKPTTDGMDADRAAFLLNRFFADELLGPNEQAAIHFAIAAVRAQQAKPLSESEILGVAEPFGAFEFGDSQGHKRLAFARAAITAFCLKNGIGEKP